MGIYPGGWGTYIVRGLYGEERQDTDKKGTHAEWVPCGVRTHMWGEMHGKRTTRNGNFTEKGEKANAKGIHTERGHTRSGDTQGVDIHDKGTTRRRERGHIRREDTYGDGIHTEWGQTRGGGGIHGKGTTRKRERNTQRGDTYGEETHGVGTYTGGGIHAKGTTRNGDYTEKGERTQTER